jgi:ATP-dependent RNA helicase DHX29
MVTVSWSKAQDVDVYSGIPHIETALYPTQLTFKMSDIATPDKRQSEGFIATAALFAIFESTKEEKAFMRLPSTWKALWAELADTRKSMNDAQDRETIKDLRAMVRERLEREEEDGVLLQGAFRGRGNRSPNMNNEVAAGKGLAKSTDPAFYQRIWAQKANTQRFQEMLVSQIDLRSSHFRPHILLTFSGITHTTTYMAFQAASA